MRDDLEAQISNLIPWWATEFGEAEIAGVTAAINNRHISQGKVTRKFEERLAETLRVPYVVCTTSGTTALTMALLACEIGQEDNVLIPNRTWIATAHAAMVIGADITLSDVDERGLLPSFTLNPNGCGYEAIIPVNLNGKLAGMPIKEPDYKYPLIIEDSCQAFPNPPRGLVSCYSLSVAKIISTGQGGFCATRDEGLYKELLSLRTHDVSDAMVPQVLEWKRFGYNFRFTDIQASIGLAQLEKLPQRLQAIAEIHAEYKDNGVPVCETPTPLYNELLHPEPEVLRAFLRERGIEARPFYPSLHTAPYLQPAHKTKYHDYEFPNSKKWSSGVILPSGPSQKLEDIRQVCRVFDEFNEHRYSVI